MVTISDSILVQYEIFPERMLSPATAQRLLSELEDIEGITRLLVHGPRVPATVPSGPAMGIEVDHSDREIVRVSDQAMELEVEVGRIRLEAMTDVEKEIRAACERVLPFSFELREGLFLRTKPTLTDYAKHGPDETVKDKRVYGMDDPNFTR